MEGAKRKPAAKAANAILERSGSRARKAPLGPRGSRQSRLRQAARHRRYAAGQPQPARISFPVRFLTRVWMTTQANGYFPSGSSIFLTTSRRQRALAALRGSAR